MGLKAFQHQRIELLSGKEVISNPTFVAMIRAIVLALISVGTLAEEGPLLQPRRAQTAAAGLPTCLCLTKLPLEEKSCTYDFAPEGLCFQVVGLAQNFTLVPASFGESCAIHYDPHQACSDLTKYPPEVKPISEQADWCMRKWCYVDPCNCDASDASKSDYFPGELTYTYGTCGDKNTYTATESATNTVGNAECTTAAEPASDANSVKMGLGLLLAGMGALA